MSRVQAVWVQQKVHGAGRGAIDPFIYSALAGEMTPEEALDGACAALDQVMADLGYQN